MSKKLLAVPFVMLVVFSLLAIWVGSHSSLFAQETEEESLTLSPAESFQLELAKVGTRGYLYLAIAIVVGLSCVGAGYAVGAVGAAAMGAVTERPELIGRAIIFVGLAEGIAIYGLLIAIMLIRLVGG